MIIVTTTDQTSLRVMECNNYYANQKSRTTRSLVNSCNERASRVGSHVVLTEVETHPQKKLIFHY